ncbi:uncharacterized protein LOC123291082, partial [Chrysoperla carnea]|uniref:uncharacterized protein LOC123291082 n=1 Tax=Chrysoperla carnea TaxID=189513 RepID=UPI001D06E5AC
YIRDIYSVQLAPDKLEFGHVCEGPHDWEQRYERKDFGAKKHQGKVRWGDKHGGYGEHYWDYNHAGHDGDGDGEESQAVEEYESYEPSESNAKAIVKNNNAGIREYTPRAKRHEHLKENMKFVYDPETGVLMDEVSGKRFKLQPIH